LHTDLHGAREGSYVRAIQSRWALGCIVVERWANAHLGLNCGCAVEECIYFLCSISVTLCDLLGKLLNTIKVGSAHVTSFEFNPAEFLLAAVTSIRTVRMWDMENFSSIGQSPTEATPIRAISFTRDGTALCTASADTLRVLGWDPVQSKGSTPVGWDRISEIRVTDDNIALCGSVISNFVSVWKINVQNVLNRAADNPSGVFAEDKPFSRAPSGKPSVRGPTRSSPDSKIERKEYPVDDKSNIDADTGSGSSAVAPEKPPSVTWESGHNSKDMATTMGESFSAKQRQRQAGGGAIAAEPKLTHDGGTVPSEPYNLEKMLPPSAFGSKAVGSSPLQSRRQPPQVEEPYYSNAGDEFGGAGRRGGGGPLGSDAPLSVVGSSHAKRRPPPGAVSTRQVGGSGAAGPTYESIEEEENSKAETSFINCVVKDGRSTTNSLNQRLISLGIFRKHWEKGEMEEIVNHLTTLQVLAQQDPKQLFSAADFFNSIELRGHGMNLEYCTKILPVLESMMDSGQEHQILSAMKTTVTLCEVFGELIRQTRSIMVAGGVDISREDRLKKCNLCHVVLMRIRSRLDSTRITFRKSAKALTLAEKLQNQLDDIS
jgi:hypothetical protein